MKALLPFLMFTPMLCAQPQPIDCNTWYVDPVRGNDSFPGTYTQPFRTLTYAALTRAATTPGIDTLVLLPGEYNDTNETFPIRMPPGVSIQGTNALNTVLISRSTTIPSILRFEPWAAGDYDGTVVDGVTFVGRNRSLEIFDGLDSADLRVSSNPTIANCFLLDAIVTAVDIVVNPGTPRSGHDLDDNDLVENRPKFIHCTITSSTIGILNRVNAAMSWGESEPGLLNVLLSDNSVSDLEGIDSLDVMTCAFATADMAMMSPIKAGRVLPIPVFNTTMNPPSYVDSAGLGIALTAVDLRLRPDSMAIDTGSQPPLVWQNGTVGQSTFMCIVDILDTDCEGYGNLRVERMQADIGADENGEMIVAGYQRGTTDLNNGANSPFPNSMVIWLTPFVPFATNPFDGVFAMNSFPYIPSVGFWRPWSGVTQHARPWLSTPPTPSGLGTLYMPISSSTVTFPLTFADPITPVVLPLPLLNGPRYQFTMQGLPVQGAASRPLSNLQAWFSP